MRLRAALCRARYSNALSSTQYRAHRKSAIARGVAPHTPPTHTHTPPSPRSRPFERHGDLSAARPRRPCHARPVWSCVRRCAPRSARARRGGLRAARARGGSYFVHHQEMMATLCTRCCRMPAAAARPPPNPDHRPGPRARGKRSAAGRECVYHQNGTYHQPTEDERCGRHQSARAPNSERSLPGERETAPDTRRG